MQMPLVLHGQIRTLQLQLHRIHLRVGELRGFEIRQTPIGLAETRQQFDAFLVGGDTVVFATACLERMTVTEPYFRLRRVLRRVWLRKFRSSP